jgi:hypothetical protein
MRLRLDVQTWPLASAKIPMTWPQVGRQLRPAWIDFEKRDAAERRPGLAGCGLCGDRRQGTEGQRGGDSEEDPVC